MDLANRSLICSGVILSGPPEEPRGNVRNAFMTSSSKTCKASKRGLSLASYTGRRSSAGPGCFARTAFRVSWFTGAGVSPEQMILTTALKLPASNLLDATAASLLLSLDSVVWQWTVGTVFVPYSCASVDDVSQISLRTASFWFIQNDSAKMQQLEPRCFVVGASNCPPENLCEHRCAGCSCGPWNDSTKSK